MKILIVGGGVAGPTLASALKDQKDVSITLIDKAPQWGNIGYAIALWGNGMRVLEKIGALHPVLQKGYQMRWNVMEDEKHHVLKQTFFKVFSSYGGTVVIPRTDLHRALTETMGENTDVRLGVTVTDIVQNESGVSVVLSDGMKDTFDLVVGADGIHSQVRETVFGSGFLKYYDWRVWAFWTPPGFSHPRGAFEATMGGRIYFTYPTEDRAVVMFAAALPPDTPREQRHVQEQLHHLMSGFDAGVHHLIDAIADPTHVFQDDLAHVDMKTWYKGRVVLTGDAQHATSPLTGMGSSLAMEDAYVLADELLRNNTIDAALSGYERRRTSRIKHFRAASDALERWLMVKSPFLAQCRDVVIRLVPADYFTGVIEKILREEI
ncbi:FAD-dependent monooxygenase [Candidatus Wolfebacteria bacterium]|nr:FAD-dependent monooxygenase [Candidatus Wolfebacteria bacterium]